jgi:hypothetical protein
MNQIWIYIISISSFQFYLILIIVNFSLSRWMYHDFLYFIPNFLLFSEWVSSLQIYSPLLCLLHLLLFLCLKSAFENFWSSFFFFASNWFFLMILNHFTVLVSKINLKKKKNIILMHFQVKNTLKSNCRYNPKCYLSRGSLMIAFMSFGRLHLLLQYLVHHGHIGNGYLHRQSKVSNISCLLVHV